MEDVVGRKNERENWSLEQRLEHEKKLAEQRRAWEERHKAEREQRVRDEKQARLEAYLKARGQAFLDHTGSLPTPDVLGCWQEEYAAERVREQERARELRRAEAERDIFG